MSVLSPKRVLLAVAATAVLATNAFATNPSPRSYPRMAFDAAAGEMILFGGTSPYDGGTKMSYDSNETWSWNGTRWVQRVPAHTPPARAAQAMTYDSTRGRIVMFGGRQMKGIAVAASDIEPITTVRDTWVYDNNDWTEVQTGSAPSARLLASMAYDSLRDRVVLYGGTSVNADGITSTPLYDTWEFDGTDWRQIDNESVKVGRPLLVYDKARSQTILVGSDTELKPHMYRLDTGTNKWVEMTPEKLPDCVNESTMAYQEHDASIVLTGGVCSLATSFDDKTWRWNGSTWAEVKTTVISRGTGMAFAYDSLRFATVMYGGNDALETRPRATTWLFRDSEWKFAFSNSRPNGRSQFVFTGDPVTKQVWLWGGVNEYGGNYNTDLWAYRGGQWYMPIVKDEPASCDSPLSAYDVDRGKLVMACWPAASLDVEIFELDSATATFKQVATTKKKPDARRQAALVYDESLKKIVLFGGYDGSDFKDDTWLWNGTDWTEVTKDKPPNRSLHAMWYDPLAKKTILYGGIGREDIDEKVKRFSDMWAFNGTGWSKLNPSSSPGERLGAQYAVDPASGRLILFGGLRHEVTDPKTNTAVQFYENDTWEWNGAASSWTKLTPEKSPSARQSGRLTYDPVSNRILLFGGFAGFYLSDTWAWNGSSWQILPDIGVRRRASGNVPVIEPPTGND